MLVVFNVYTVYIFDRSSSHVRYCAQSGRLRYVLAVLGCCLIPVVSTFPGDVFTQARVTQRLREPSFSKQEAVKMMKKLPKVGVAGSVWS